MRKPTGVSNIKAYFGIVHILEVMYTFAAAGSFYIMHFLVLQAQRDRFQRDEQMAQEERLARELENRKLEGIRDEKMRQQIRETR